MDVGDFFEVRCENFRWISILVQIFFVGKIKIILGDDICKNLDNDM